MRIRTSSRSIAAGLFALACLAPPVAFATLTTGNPPVATGPAQLAELKALAVTDVMISHDLAVYIPKDNAVLARTDNDAMTAIDQPVNTLSTASQKGGAALRAACLAVTPDVSVNRSTSRSHAPPPITGAVHMICIITDTADGVTDSITLDDRQRLHTVRPLITAKRAAAGLREVPSPEIV